MSRIILGPRTWEGSRDSDGHRTYNLVYRIETDDVGYGPAYALLTPGLPRPGSWWIVGKDRDLWAWCRWDVTMKPVLTDGSPGVFWDLGFTFSTKPPENQGKGGKPSYCKDFQVEDPLLEPYKISGGTKNDKEEAQIDRFGMPILTSSWEQIRGPQVEFDKHHSQVRIEFNVAVLNDQLCDSMVDAVNAYPLWGYPPRTVRLATFDWEKKYYGNCFPYYTRKFEFERNIKGFDRNIMDEGTKVLNGHWDTTTGAWVLDNIGGGPPNPNNPLHFRKAIDRQGNPTKIILNGRGLPASALTGSSKLFLAIVGSTNAPLSDSTKWVPLFDVGSKLPTTGNDWIKLYWKDGGVAQIGMLTIENNPTTLIATVFVCLHNDTVSNPFDATGDWQTLGQLPGFSLTNAGNYSGATTYSSGQYVKDLASTYGAGCRHVEKYDAADFLLLGIPATY